MKPEQIEPIVKWALKIFPNTAPERVALLSSLLAEDNYDKDVVVAELKTNAVRNDYLNLRSLRDALQANMKRKGERIKAYDKESIATAIRKTDQTKYVGVGDVALLMVHFSDSWHAVKAKPLDEKTVSEMRSMLIGTARRAFKEIGLSQDEIADAIKDCLPADEKASAA